MKKIKKYLVSASLMLSVIMFSFSGSFAEAVTYTSSDVSAHNTSSDCWVIINSNVYNLNSFISSHSGGQNAIVSQCGKNGTTVFNNGPHAAGTLNAINGNIIGTLGVSTPNPVLTTLSVTPASPVIIIGGTQQLATSTKDQNGTSVAATLSFASSNLAVATVNSVTGLVTGVSSGTATITTTAVKGSITLTKTNIVTVTNVLPTLVLANVVISPATSNLSVGETAQLSALPKDQNDVAFVGATNTFTSSNTNVATINNSGVVTGISAGTATITVTSVSGNVTVTDTTSVTVSTVINSHEGDDDDEDYYDDDSYGHDDDDEEDVNHDSYNDDDGDNKHHVRSDNHNEHKTHESNKNENKRGHGSENGNSGRDNDRDDD